MVISRSLLKMRTNWWSQSWLVVSIECLPRPVRNLANRETITHPEVPWGFITMVFKRLWLLCIKDWKSLNRTFADPQYIACEEQQKLTYAVWRTAKVLSLNRTFAAHRIACEEQQKPKCCVKNSKSQNAVWRTAKAKILCEDQQKPKIERLG